MLAVALGNTVYGILIALCFVPVTLAAAMVTGWVILHTGPDARAARQASNKAFHAKAVQEWRAAKARELGPVTLKVTLPAGLQREDVRGIAETVGVKCPTGTRVEVADGA
jgi:cytochrome P450